MRKTCKCGNVLSDVKVPNNVIYWTIPIDDLEKFLRRYIGEFPENEQIAIWHCNVCNRFYHWGSDWNLYTYKLSKFSKPEDVSVDWNSIENMYFSFNDFEDEVMSAIYKDKGILEYPHKVYGGTGFEKIYVLSDNKVKVYVIEEKLSMRE